MKSNIRWSRRAFAKTVAAAGAAATLAPGRVLGANERVRLGFIGLGNRGDQVLDAFLAHPDAQVAAVCDLSQAYMDFASRKAGTNPRQFKDYRRLLEMRDLDAVVIATPDHWHALQTIEACQANRDVYVEKPLSLCVLEGRRMVEAVRRHNRVCQAGIHRRSVPFCREAAEYVQSGALGKITAARAFHIQNEWPQGIGKSLDEPAPADLDWDAWLGPAPKVPFNRNRAFYRFRWFFDYSGGQLTNFGVHYIDFIQWALGVQAPEAVAVMGGKWALEDTREIPDTLEAMWQYPGGVLATFSQFNANSAPAGARGGEVEIRGTKGTLYLQGNGYEVVPEPLTDLPFPARSPIDRSLDRAYRARLKTLIEPKAVKAANSADTVPHARDFLDCVKSRRACKCDIETAHRSTSATLIANIALKTRSLLQWDARQEQFINHPEANTHLQRPYRAPYRFPEAAR